MALSKYQKDYEGLPRYEYKPPTNEQKEKEWERQSLERQRAERVEEAAARGAAPVAPPPKQPQTSVYSNPGVTPKPTYSNQAVSKIEKDYSAGGVTPKPTYSYRVGFGSPVSLYDQQKKPKTYSFQPEIPGENVIVKPQPNFKPQDSGFYWNPMPQTGLRNVTLDDKLKEQDLYRFKPVVDSIRYTPPDQSPVEKPISKWEINANNYMQSLGIDNVNSKPLLDASIAADMNNYMRQFAARNPTATKMQQQEFEKLLQKELLERYYNRVKDITIPSTPPASPTTPYVNPLSYLPRTTYQEITQNELLKGLPKLPVSPPYNAVNTPAKETPENESSSDSGSYSSGSIVTTPSYGQGGKVVVMPPKTGGYTAQELEAAGNRARTDEKYFEGLAYEGYYLAPNGKYYPINYPKAAYAISQGMRNPIQTQYYEGYSKDVDDFIRTFGPEELWRYSPNWKNEGLKYSNPTTTPAPVWNTSNSGSPSGSGNVGGLYSEDPRLRGWYFNPAVNWNT